MQRTIKILNKGKYKVMSYIIKRRIKLSHENLPLKLSNIEHEDDLKIFQYNSAHKLRKQVHPLNRMKTRVQSSKNFTFDYTVLVR
jgi:hypothetical protein